ncbi:hypothetical protein [Dipodfec virus UA23Rod_1661]|uniref:Uncharacterized protein n=1 Tax=Dipodfec virus UA23Rod_1661 TaxID=2929254 RepID=A0A976N0Z5_9VIRU|nr:hypothetical protein [Dipodfec virus UA23Rod_1661]
MDWEEDLKEELSNAVMAVSVYKKKVHEQLEEYMDGKLTKEEIISEIIHYRSLVDYEKCTFKMALNILEQPKSK